MKTANEALRFVLELCMLAAFACWGANTGDGTGLHVLLAIALAATGATALAIAFAAVTAVNTALLHLGQGEI